RAGGGVLEVDRPVERGVAAAHDHAALAGEVGLALDEVVEGAAAPLLEALDRQRARLERAVPGRDDDRARGIWAALVGRDRPQLLAAAVDALERLDRLAQE